MEKRYPGTILATACVPWTESYEIDEPVFIAGVRKLLDQNLRHIYLFGTAGEGYAVSDRQYQRLVTLFVQAMDRPDCQPMIGLISLSFETMKERLAFAYAQGIRDYMFAFPAWGALQDDELDLFLHDLLDPYPDCRFLHYNNVRSKRLLSAKEYEVLAETFPNLAGAKYSTGDLSVILSLAANPSPLRFFLTETGFSYGSQIGDFGLLLSIGNCNLPQAWRYYEACLAHQTEAVIRMQQELSEMTQKLKAVVGPGIKIDGSYDKIFSKIQDPAFPLRLLPPYIGTTDEAYQAFCAYLRKEQPAWIAA